MRRVRWLFVSVVAFGAGPLAGCSVPHLYSAPATFTVSNQAVAKVIEDVMALNSTTTIAGEPDVNCANETRCTIAYAIQQSLGGSTNWEDNELIRPTRQIWKTLFTDPKFESGTITVSGSQPLTGASDQPYYKLSCDRQHTAHVDWSDIDGWGLRRSCDYSPLADGMPGT